MTTSLNCEFDKCKWTSPTGSLESVVKLLEIHVTSKHSPGPGQQKVERAKRPEIGAELSDEDWNYFLSRWKSYKKSTNLSGEDIVL